MQDPSMGFVRKGTTATKVYYARSPGDITGKRMPTRPLENTWISTFVTVRALLDIKLIRCDAEHVVALDAHAVEDRAAAIACLAQRLHAGLMLVNGSIGGRHG
jgi:hypothetical protein